MDNNILLKERTDFFSKKVALINVVLTFLIVLLHAKTPERWGLELSRSFGFIYWTHQITLIGVPTFFFLSGLLFYRRCEFGEIERKLKSRAHSLLVPYLIWNCLFVGIFYILVHVPALHQKMNMGETLSRPYEIVYAILNSRHTVLWFVKDLMIYCAFSAVIYLCIERLWVAILALGLSVLLAHVNDIGYEHPLLWLPIYLTGAVIGRHFLYDANHSYHIIMYDVPTKVRSFYAVLMLCAMICLCTLSGIYGGEFTFIYRIVSPLLLWITIDLVLRDFLLHRFIVKRWMHVMFFVFCTHHFVLNVVQKVVVLTLPPTETVLNVTFVSSAVIVFVILVKLACFLSRFKFYKYLSGGR